MKVTLGIDPGTREFGFAAFRDTQLLDWGVKSLRRTSVVATRTAVLERVFTKLIHDLDPQNLVLVRRPSAGTADAQREAVVRCMKVIAVACSLGILEIPLPEVRATITGHATATARIEAITLVHSYPVLKAQLTQTGWRARYQQKMFAAVAAAATYVQQLTPN